MACSIPLWCGSSGLLARIWCDAAERLRTANPRAPRPQSGALASTCNWRVYPMLSGGKLSRDGRARILDGWVASPRGFKQASFVEAIKPTGNKKPPLAERYKCQLGTDVLRHRGDRI
ncbi:hypothetical protein [Synechococcus sp. MIT S1220]|uniref:hypothetical protein n=1 Tax=Synechococcus sp. MIT S1220 TaxID=3082549 RepID=UPI0039B03D46